MEPTLEEQEEDKIRELKGKSNIIIDNADEILDLLKHKEGILELSKDIKGISAFVSKAKKVRDNKPLLNLVDDKSLVIIGVVVIALVGMWKLTDPTILLSSAISGLFGVATGKAISDKDKDE